MTITGRQIREARALLRLQRNELAAMTDAVTTATISRAESVDEEPPITIAHAQAIRQSLEQAGIEFLPENGGGTSVWLRRRDDMVPTGRQIREARALLGLSPSALAVKAKVVTTDTVKRAEADYPRPPPADSHVKAIRQTLEALGIDFAPEGPRLRKVEP